MKRRRQNQRPDEGRKYTKRPRMSQRERENEKGRERGVHLESYLERCE
jgi:hypothetical protein